LQLYIYNELQHEVATPNKRLPVHAMYCTYLVYAAFLSTSDSQAL